MSFKANGKEVKYTTCFQDEVYVNGEPYTTIGAYDDTTLNKLTRRFQFQMFVDEDKLQAGQVYKAQLTIVSHPDNVIFNYVPDGNQDHQLVTAENNPTGLVTLTEVTSSYIKGTFSAVLYSRGDPNGNYIQYGATITEGTFYCNHHTNRTVIPN